MEKPKILIIDDEKIILAAIKKALKRERFEILTTQSGHEAIQILRESLPTVVILDLLMPGMNGIQFLETINLQPDDPYGVIVMAGSGGEEDLQNCYDLGAYSFLCKPFDSIEMISHIQQLIKIKGNYSARAPK